MCYMTTRFGQSSKKKTASAVTLVEVVMSIAILALVMGGVIQGYIQTNRQAEWSYMSLAAQSSASQTVEQAMAAKWFVRGTNITELTPPQQYTRTNSMVVPTTGQAIIVTNYVWVTVALTNPQLRQIRADCAWQFPRTGIWYSNTVITCRAPIQ